MELLNNFSSIYCFITFVLGAMFMFTTLCIAAMCKTQEPKNKVHFYVARDMSGSLWLYMGKPIRFENFFARGCGEILLSSDNFPKIGLNVHDFDNLKWEDEPVEVFIKMDD